jgi:hypothetical protein
MIMSRDRKLRRRGNMRLSRRRFMPIRLPHREIWKPGRLSIELHNQKEISNKLRSKGLNKT